MTVLDRPCPCGSAHRLIADVESRLDDVFTYPGGQVVHPHVFAEVAVVDRLERQAAGKVRRFVPLEAAVVSRPA